MKRNFLTMAAVAFSIVSGVGQNTGIGVAAPTNALHVVSASNPLRLVGLQSGADTDSILTVSNTGVVRYRALNITSAGWSTTGNGGINPATHFVGTLNNVALVFRTNNMASGFIDPSDTKRNTAFGAGAISTISIAGSGNNAFGYMALKQVGAGVGNNAFGDSALYAVGGGSHNIAIGSNALEANLSSENIAIGSNALLKNVGGSNNTAIGVLALNNNTSAINNIAIGGEALKASNANDNVMVGYRAGSAITTGQQNTAVGNYAMLTNISGNNNTYLGYQAAQLQTNGSNNSFVGFLAGGNFLGGSNNTMIGTGADASTVNAGHTNSTSIGAGALVTQSNMVRLGNTSTTLLSAQVNLTVTSDMRVKKNVEENIPGLAFIQKLRPVSYNYDLQKMDELMGKKNINKASVAGYAEKEKIRYTGFIAQEVYDAAQQLGYNFSGVSTPVNGEGLYGLAYAEMVVPLVKAVQELKAITEKQQQEIEKLKAQLLQNK
jgi:hypothetical protein